MEALISRRSSRFALGIVLALGAVGCASDGKPATMASPSGAAGGGSSGDGGALPGLQGPQLVVNAGDGGAGRRGGPPGEGDAGCVACVSELGAYCGTIGDGCGGALECGDCPEGQRCGVYASNVCAPAPGTCTPMACKRAAVQYCGAIHDGCGTVEECGSCDEGWSCGGGGIEHVCAAKPGAGVCEPATCHPEGARYCGRIGDGCGGVLECGGCAAGQACEPATHLCRTPCALCAQIRACDRGTTTVTGTVYSGAAVEPLPIYNALVYVPNGPLPVLKSGAKCERCTSLSTDQAVVSTVSGPDGSFTLSNVPVGEAIPLVVQLGHWRRETTIRVNACVENSLPAGAVRLPRNSREGDIPLTAIATSYADPLECLVRKLGIEDSEFANPTGTGRVHLYYTDGPRIDEDSPLVSSLVDSVDTLMPYDQVLFPSSVSSPVTHDTRANVIEYVNRGGRSFHTHMSYDWFRDQGPVQASVQWTTQNTGHADTATGLINDSFPKGASFVQWLQVAGALKTVAPPQVELEEVFGTFTGVTPDGGAQDWITTSAPAYLQQFTLNMPVKAPPESVCGRITFSSFHVVNSSVSLWFPDECTMGPMTPQEKVLAFMLLDLASCIRDEAAPPLPPAPPPPPPPPPPPLPTLPPPPVIN